VSIFAAEINGRTSEEDFLLSRFFGTVAIADRSRILGALLPEVGLEIARSDLSSLKFEFWKPYFRATPAVVLEAESGLVFFESPADLAAERWRLFDECKEGVKGNGHFALVVITRHTAEPEEIATIRRDETARHRNSKVHWTNWQTLYKKIHALSRTEELDDVSRRLIADLLALLEEKGLGGFVGYPSEAFDRAIRARTDLVAFAQLTGLLIAEVNATLGEAGVHPLAAGTVAGESSDGFLIPGHATFRYREESWEMPQVALCHYFLKVSLTAPQAWVGYRIDLTDPARRALLTEKRAQVGAALEASPSALLTLQRGEEIAEADKVVRAGQGGLGFLESRDALRGITHANLVLPLGEEDLASERLASLITERFLLMRACIDSLGLYPAPETDSAHRFVVTSNK
jgi:hypothetical protein